ncbi:MAG: hypothetical protein WB808_14940 [Candidatus Dormiibacterota bacterium]
MGKHDPEAFQELFDAEPSEASQDDAVAWVDLYRRLIAMMERQLDETRAFAASVPDAVREYLGRENITILEEEIEIFRRRLSHWTNTGKGQS